MRPHLRLVEKGVIQPPKTTPNDPAFRVLPLTPELLGMVAATSLEPGLANQLVRPEAFAAALSPELSFAVLDGGAVVAAFGLIPMWHGLGQAWCAFTTLARPRHKAAVTRIGREKFDAWNAMPAYRRIEIHVRDGQPWRQTFARRLGMTECHGPLRKWDASGRDYWLYARVA